MKENERKAYDFVAKCQIDPCDDCEKNCPYFAECLFVYTGDDSALREKEVKNKNS